MDNAQIADMFDEMADLLELKGEGVFRVRAYRNGAKAIRDLTEPVTEILNDSSRSLTDVPGIGDTLEEKTRAIVATGRLVQLDELKKQVPESLIQLLRIPGLGAKKAAALFDQLKIESVEQLRQACEANQVQKLKGFGAKTEAALLDSIRSLAATSNRLRLDEADSVVQSLRQHFDRCPAVTRLDFAGSFRRGKETIGDLDMLVVSDQVDQVMEHFSAFPRIEKVLARGETKMSVRMQGGFQVDLRVVPRESFGAALQYFTGSKEHNVELRGRAKKLGLRINEYGVYREDAPEVSVAGAEEADVYAVVGLSWIPPELRENRIEFDAAEKDQMPELITVDDLRGDLHMHTTATDGEATLEQMIQAAMARGWEYIAITDHSQRVSMARGLNPERLREQWKEIDQWNQRLGDEFHVLKGIECDILEAGGMDLPDDVLAEADWVLASIHYGQKQSRQQITERVLGAVENRFVHAIAHPTGRLLGRRPAYEIDLDLVMKAIASHRKFIELNANPMRLDLSDTGCLAAKRLGIPIAIDSDAHSIGNFDLLRFGILQARRAGLVAKDVINTLPYTELMKAIRRLV